MPKLAPLFVLALAALPSAARGETPAGGDTPVDISSVKDKLTLLTDGKQHYLALVPFEISDEFFFYGDGKSFWAQRTYGGSRDGDKGFGRTFWEPRVARPYQASFQLREGKYEVQCDERRTELKPVEEAEAKRILGSARFFKPRWKHRAYALARDDRGNYYFVDKIREPEESKSFRLYGGPKGKLKPLKMTNVVSDSEGDIFSTRSGALRLILSKNESQWVKGKSSSKLTLVPIEDNHVLIYTDLGVYTGRPLGTPCDDL